METSNIEIPVLSILTVVSALFLIGCGSESIRNNEYIFELIPASESNINFINSVENEKEFNIFSYRNFYNGGGVAIGDINNDGLDDIFFSSNSQSNQLYLNLGDFHFKNITDHAGVAGKNAWTTGVTMADVNGDGWLDIYVCYSGEVELSDLRNELFINKQDGTFVEEAADYKLDDISYSTHAAFFDYDKDGDLDCYLLNNSMKSPERVLVYTNNRDDVDSLGGDKLLRNDSGKFTNVSKEAGIFSSALGFGLGLSLGDVNGDSWPDIYVSNDFWERDYLYINGKDGTFSESLENYIDYTSISSMGSDIGDLDNDGDYDIFSTDMLPADNYRIKVNTDFDAYYVADLKYQSNFYHQILQNCLQINRRDGHFTEEANIFGIAATDWSWGALMFDFNLDGWTDIFVSNGIFHDITNHDFRDFISDKEEIKKIVEKRGELDLRDFIPFFESQKIENYAFLNQSGLRFENSSRQLGLGEKSFSNGAAYGDLDNDGDLDLVVNNVNMPSFLYRNKTRDNDPKNSHYLKVGFRGQHQNKYGIGASITIFSKGTTQHKELYQSRGYESAVAPYLVFGLGDDTSVDSMIVVWPSQKKQKLDRIPVDTIWYVEELSASKFIVELNEDKAKYFEPITVTSTPVSHLENRFNDFDHESLLPYKLSNLGPKILKGDINKDQKEDFILLGAAGMEDLVFVQNKDGKFETLKQTDFVIDKNLESTCGALIDVDNDNDKDLIIGVGGNEFEKGFSSYQVRYYTNIDGKGNFVKEVFKAPNAAGNMSCVAPSDFDNDGDIDLFLGANAIPGNYGLIPRSFLLRNEGGNWVDATTELTGNIGLVSDACWSDYDRDGDDDLIVVGNWMPITILINNNGVLNDKITIPGSRGWWNCIEKRDLDNNGFEDFVLGNWGLNSRLTASAEKPLTMYVKDYDQNGKSEFIINWHPPGDEKSYPFASIKDLRNQMPGLKKQAMKYEELAEKQYQDLIPAEARVGALALETETLASAVLWNDKGSLSLSALPREAQLAPVYAIVIEDIDLDKQLDLMLFGNQYEVKPELGRLEANKGVVLLQDQKEFNFLPFNESGIYVDGQVRDAEILHLENDQKILMIARNNAEAKFYKFKYDPELQ